MTRRFRIRGGALLAGTVRVPGDKSIGHRGVIFAALGRGRSTLTGFSGGEDNVATIRAFQAMGVAIQLDGERVTIDGVGLRGLRMPNEVIDCGNSGTTMRLLSGLLAGQHFGARLVGDASLSGRPMRRVVGPLRARGAHIAGVRAPGDHKRAEADDECYSPLSIAPLLEDERLAGIEYDMPVASAQVKSCLLLSGLYASGPTVLREPHVSRDHTERMMNALGAPVSTAGSMVQLDPQAWDGAPGWDGFEWRIPGDLSSAAFVLVAALAMRGSEVCVQGVGVNPTRTGLLDGLRLMGAGVQSVPKSEGAGGEPCADLHVTAKSRVRGTLIGGELLTRMIDEVPALCALAASASGTTEIRDAKELRVKESDRIAAMARVLHAFGVPAVELDDGLRIEGGATLQPAQVSSEGDHRIAMAATVLALQTEGESFVDDVECVATSFPGFAAQLRGLGADVVEIES